MIISTKYTNLILHFIESEHDVIDRETLMQKGNFIMRWLMTNDLKALAHLHHMYWFRLFFRKKTKESPKNV